MESMARREWIAAAGAAFAAGRAAGEKPAARKLKIVVVGGHPGDPEASCGGTMVRLAAAGHEVVALYATQGEKGVKGKSAGEAATLRGGEARRACALLGGAALFHQIDGDTEINAARYDAFRKALEAERPDAAFAHWPIDVHRDHRVSSLLVYDAWLAGGRKFALYYFETASGAECQHFRPTHYVDIAAAEPRKKAACFVHASQDPAEFYALHEAMHRFRGAECGRKLAEAFIHHEQSPAIELPA